MSSRDMIREVLEILKPRRTPPPLAKKDTPRVYLLYDATTDRDGRAADRVRDAVRTERLELIVPQIWRGQRRRFDGAASAASPRLRRRARMPECCAATGSVAYQTVPEVLFAEQTLKRPPMKSKGFLLGEPDMFPDLPNVIPLIDGARPNLDSFLRPFRNQGEAGAI